MSVLLLICLQQMSAVIAQWAKKKLHSRDSLQEVSSLQLCSEWLWNLCSLSSYHPIDTEYRVPEYSRMKPHSSGQYTHYRNFTSTSSTVRFLKSTPENCGAAAVKQAYTHYRLAKSYIHSLNCVVSCVDMPHEIHITSFCIWHLREKWSYKKSKKTLV